jgi:hypothetical protein
MRAQEEKLRGLTADCDVADRAYKEARERARWVLRAGQERQLVTPEAMERWLSLRLAAGRSGRWYDVGTDHELKGLWHNSLTWHRQDLLFTRRRLAEAQRRLKAFVQEDEASDG